MNKKIYGELVVEHDVEPPLHHRQNSVLYWKKAWSYFMLDQNTPWSEVSKYGNPTESAQMNLLLRAMSRMEAARRGKPSEARRALVASEYEAIIAALSKHSDFEVGTYGCKVRQHKQVQVA